MTAVRLDRKQSDHAVSTVESLVWAVLMVSGLGIVIWTVAQVLGNILLA